MNLDEEALRGLLLGDGLFETIRVEDGLVHLRGDHIQRIQRSGDALGYRPAVLEKAVEAIRALGEDGLWRVTMLRSGEVIEHRRDLDDRRPPEVVGLRGFYFPGDRLAEHKTLSWGRSLEALRRVRAQGADEVVRLSPEGVIGEAATGNLFFWVDGRWRTPRVDGLLPGVYRGALIEWANAHGESVEETRLTEEVLERVEAMVITSAGWVAMPVHSVNHRLLNVEFAGRFCARFCRYLRAGAD